jgi:hypothetical protein
MPKRSSKKSRDADQTATFVVARLPAAAEAPIAGPSKDPAAVALGRKGGLKGGKARAAALTKQRRVQIAKGVAEARWKPSN